MLLQVLEDGRLTDSRGRAVSFRNTIIIMTSNVGASRFGRGAAVGFGAARAEHAREDMLSELKKTFSPEFLNRVDEIVLFNQLSAEQTLAIARLMLERVKARIAMRGITLSISPEAEELLSRDGFDPQYGAALRRLIQHRVEDSLSEELLSGRIRLGDSVSLEVREGGLQFVKL
jgi:ATP-dependent Clp protease ATP-binding subunit ClpC